MPTRPERVEGATWTFYDSFRAFPLSTMSKGKRDDNVVADIMLGLDDAGGGTRGEWRVAWHRFNERSDDASPHLEAFSDSWATLAKSHLIDLLATLDEEKRLHLTPDEFMGELRALGWCDRTDELVSGFDKCPTCYGREWHGDQAIVNWRRRVESGVSPMSLAQNGSAQ